MLKQRIITSLILAPLALVLVFFTPLTLFSYCTALITLLGAWEWSSLMGLKERAHRATFTGVIGLFVALILALWPIGELWQNGILQEHAKWVLNMAFVWWLFAAILVKQYPKNSQAWCQGMAFKSLSGVMILIPLFIGLNVLRSAHYSFDQSYGSMLIVAVLGIVWAADIGAYFSGKNFGKHKLMPHVSPNKTIEGLVGGLIASSVFFAVFCYFSGVESSKILPYTALAIFVAVFSALGDLVESLFKREAGIKDSGSCLPGHGGILDRLDSLTAAAPVFALFYGWAAYL